MRVAYICKQCGAAVATVQADGLHDRRLGLAYLTPEERQSVLSMRGGDLTVHTYCDTCGHPRPLPERLHEVH